MKYILTYESYSFHNTDFNDIDIESLDEVQKKIYNQAVDNNKNADRGFALYYGYYLTVEQLSSILGIKPEVLTDNFIPCMKVNFKTGGKYSYKLSRALNISTKNISDDPKETEIFVKRIKRETEKAYLLEFADKEEWVPKYVVTSKPKNDIFLLKRDFVKKNFVGKWTS